MIPGVTAVKQGIISALLCVKRQDKMAIRFPHLLQVKRSYVTRYEKIGVYNKCAEALFFSGVNIYLGVSVE